MSHRTAKQCFSCTHWLRGTEDNPRSPYGDCLATEEGQECEQTRWDDRCDKWEFTND